MLQRSMFLLAVMFASGLWTDSISIVEACPMCKVANETDAHLPRAYMYSILFMLAMPGMIVTGLGVGLYRLNRKETAELGSIEQFARDNPPGS